MTQQRNPLVTALAQATLRQAMFPHRDVELRTLWSQQGDATAEDWRRRAGAIIEDLRAQGYVITKVEDPTPGSTDIVVTDVPSMRAALQEVARRGNVSLTHLTRRAGVSNTVATFALSGDSERDVHLGLALRVVAAGEHELVLRRRVRPTKAEARLLRAAANGTGAA